MSIGRYTTYNFLGGVVPIAVSLVSVPLFLGLIGAERYGVLALAWLLFGYFSVFDLGLSKAATQRIAAQRDGDARSRATTFWSALVVNGATGVIGGIILYVIADLVVGRYVQVNPRIDAEFVKAIPVLAAAIPVATISGVLGGSLRARERFLEVNAIASLTSVLTQLVPLAIAWLLGPQLPGLIFAMVASMCVGVALQWLACRRHIILGFPIRVRRDEVLALLRFGGWVTVSAVIGPLMIVLDRFIIGAVLGAVAVTVYTIPWQLTQRLLLLPASLQMALFPRQTAAVLEEQRRLTAAGIRAVAAVTTPLAVGGIFLMEPFLHLWLGDRLPIETAAEVGRIAMFGFWSTGMAYVPFAQTEARGHVRTAATVHLVELPFYLVLLFVLLDSMGITGAAIAFATRCVIDAIVFNHIGLKSKAAWGLPATMTALLIASILACELFQSGSFAWSLAFAALLALTFTISIVYAPRPLRDFVVRQLPVSYRPTA